MTCIWRNLLNFILATALLLAGMAQATAGVAMAQQVALNGTVICGETGAQLWLFAPDGTPVPVLPMSDCENCPACVQVLTFTVPAATPGIAADVALSRLVTIPPHHQLVLRLALRPNARGPPL